MHFMEEKLMEFSIKGLLVGRKLTFSLFKVFFDSNVIKMYVCENSFITTHQDTIKPSLDIIGSISNILFQVNMIYLTKDLMLLLLGLEN